MIRSFLKNETGSTAIEYGLVAGLIAVAVIVSLQMTGTSVENLYDTNGELIVNAIEGSS